MRKRDSIESGSSEEEEETSDDEDSGDGKLRSDGASEYEKQRLSRMADNRARMEALGLRKMASSFMTTTMVGSSKSNTKRKKVKSNKDDDYRPEDERPPTSSSEEDSKPSTKRKNSVPKNVKKTVSDSKKKASARKESSNPGYIDDDEAFKKAIALSLRESGLSKSSDTVVDNDSKGKRQFKEDPGKKNRKKPFVSRLQMTEDELLVHFFQFDDNWKDGISVRDLERVATQHDFSWTDKELADMIDYFDSNGDGKVSLDDFRKIAMSCKMIEGCE